MTALMLKRRCAFCGKRGADPVGCAAEIVGGQTKLAAAIGVRQQHVWNWMNRDAVPPEFCAAIERATKGKVTRRDLRPADWHLIWPELVSQEHPAPTTDQAAA